MADIYVDKDFAGGGNDGTISNPWTTIQLALDNQTAGNTDTIHIKEATTDYTEALVYDVTNDGSVLTLQPYAAPDNDVTIFSAGFSGAYLNGMTTGSITHNDLKFRSSGVDTSNIFRLDALADVSLTSNRCGFGNDADNEINCVLMTAFAGSPTRNIAFDTCTFTHIVQIAGPEDVASFTLSNSTYTETDASATSGRIVNIKSIATEIHITDNVIENAKTGSGAFVQFFDSTEDVTTTLCKITGNTVTLAGGGCFKLNNSEVGTGQVFIEDNDITINAASSVGMGIEVGGNTSTIGDFPTTKIMGNSVRYTGALSDHCYLIGRDVLGCYVSDNFAEGGNAGYVVKTDRATLVGNIGIGPSTLVTKGCKSPNIRNNTFIADSGAVYLPSDNADATPTEYNGVVNNIFLLTGTATRFIASDVSAPGVEGPGGHWIDYNCWWDDGSSSYVDFANIEDETNPTNFTEMQALWLTWTPVEFPLNMANGLNVNPQLDSNYKPQNSEVINGGKPDANGDSTSIGAIGATAGGKGRYSGGGRYS